MEPPSDPPSMPSTPSPAGGGFARLAPLLEGGLLALLVLMVLTLGGETVRTGHEGYLHAALGEAVQRDGLVPESPWHAGTRAEDATLHSLLVTTIGDLGVGPLWAIALLAVLGAALFPPALDSLGKVLGLNTTARRLVFLVALLGFNGLGWLGALPADGGGLKAAMAVDGGYLPPLPLLSLLPMTFPDTAFAWDGRLAAFLPALLESGPFALALPFLLLALAWGLRTRTDAPWRAALCAGLALALEPRLGVCAVLLLAVAWGARMRSGKIAPAAAGRSILLTLAVALPFLLPVLMPQAHGPDLRAEPLYALHGGWSDLFGPLLLVLPAGLCGLALCEAGRRRTLLVALVPLSLAAMAGFGRTDGVELSRLAALAWAFPAGMAAAALARRPLGAIVVAALLLICLPTSVRAFQAYRYWDASSPLPLSVEGGALALVEDRVAAWPPQVAAAEAELEADAVLVFHPRHPATRVAGALSSLGNALAPLLHHSLYVDLPHAANARAADLETRLDRAHALWEGRGWSLGPDDVAPLLTPDAALAGMRAEFPGRGLAIVSVTSHGASAQLFRQSGGSLLAEQQGTSLWWFPPQPPAAAD
jgi:hypothetical protein